MFSGQLAEWQDARSQAQTCLTTLAQVLSFVNEYRDSQGRSFELAGLVQGNQPYSLREAIVHGEQALKSFRALKLDKNKPVALGTWRGLLAALTDVRNVTGALAGNIATVNADGRSLSIVNGSTVAVGDGGETVADFTQPATSLVTFSDVLLQQASVVMTSASASVLARNNQEEQTVADFAKGTAAALATTESQARQARETAGQLHALLDDLTSRRTGIQNDMGQAQSSMAAQVEEAKSLLEQVRSTAGTVNENASVVATRMNDVTGLKSQMDRTNDALTAYEATLETTKASVQDAIQKSGQIISDFDAKRADVERVIQDAEKMLSGATGAGLATSFAQERTSLDRSMFWASIWFGVGIVLLIVTSVALAAYVLNLPFTVFGIDLTHPSGPGVKAPFEPTIAGVLSRAVVLIGPFWLTLFSARRYRSLFELRQRYSHKYNMAVSMEGFKKQAPGFEDKIAAWVFYMVAQDPVPVRPGSPMDEPPSVQIKDWADIFTDVVRKVFGGKPPA
jgi:hypothetical protein